MARSTHRPLSPIAAAALLAASTAWAQTPSAELTPITVTGQAAPAARVAGWGDIPLAKTPMQASVFTAEQLKDSGATRLSDITASDPAVSDAYNSEGYWDFLTVRGFVLDNRFNFRRDGLPINAETLIPLDNKERIEILKGTSGMQAGTSAPGGLVNYVVKRPTDAPLRTASIAWRQPGSVTGAVDLSQRFGEGRVFGVRLNAAAAHLDPMVRSSTGNRQLFALAADWRLSADTLLEAEFETSHRSQPSQPGFSMLGNTVPAPGDPRINLNNQPWSVPVVFNANTASLRWQQKLSTDWRFIAHAATQQLKTDDRLAFPFGCSKEGNFDRYCSDGTFDFYAFRSDNEKRTTDTLDLRAEGRLDTGGIKHQLAFGVLGSRYRIRLQPQLDSGVIVGTGSVDGLTVVPNLPTLGTIPNTDRTERSTEFYLRDAVAINEDWTAWLGLRHSRLDRDSVRTDGSQVTRYNQAFTTPFLAASYAFRPGQLVYASWGRGVESEVAPNRDKYTNRGEALPALKSRQAEVGIKGASQNLEWGVAWFDIVRPAFVDIGPCDEVTPDSCTHQVDGVAHHRGVEATGAARLGAWTLRAGTQWLHARREGSQTATTNGLEPTNVPALTFKWLAAYDVASVPGLKLQGNLLHESERKVLPDNTASIPSVTRVDTGLRYDTKTGDTRWTWRAGIDNLFNKRAWRESPYQFGHAYLFPVAPRTARVSLEIGL